MMNEVSRWGMHTMCYCCPQWETITRTSCGMRGIHSVTQNCAKPLSITSVPHCQFSIIQWYRTIMSMKCLFIRYNYFCWNRRSTSHHQTVPWPNSMQELTGPQIVNRFPTFYVAQRFITAFTRNPTCPYTDQPSPCLYSTSWRLILYYPSIYTWIFHGVSFPRVSPPKPCVHLSCSPYLLQAPPISFLIRPYLEPPKSTQHTQNQNFQHLS